MNLIDEDFNAKKEVDQTKKITRIIIVAIILVIIAIAGIFAYMLYLQSLNLKVIVNDQQNADIANLLVFENDGTIYVPVRKIASYFSYDSYNGEYTTPEIKKLPQKGEAFEDFINSVDNDNDVLPF